MAEILIKCPICFSEQHCFEDTQEKFKSYMCFNCGFMSSSYYKKGTIQRKEHLESTAQLIRELEFFDEERDIYWYPSVVNMGPKGIIFPEGDESVFRRHIFTSPLDSTNNPLLGHQQSAKRTIRIVNNN